MQCSALKPNSIIALHKSTVHSSATATVPYIVNKTRILYLKIPSPHSSDDDHDHDRRRRASEDVDQSDITETETDLAAMKHDAMIYHIILNWYHKLTRSSWPDRRTPEHRYRAATFNLHIQIEMQRLII